MSTAVIGEKLRQAREKKGLTMEQVQKQTLIHASVVMALEEGKCDEILTPTYVKSFLKKYSNFLGLDSKEILGEYASLHADQAAPSLDLTRGVKPKKRDSKDSILFLRRALFGGVAFLVIAAFVFLAVVSARFLYSLSPRPGRIEKAAVKPKKDDSRIKAANQKKLAKQASSGSSKAAPPKGAPLYVVLKVKAPVWVELKRDGEKIFQRVLPKGLAESITAREKVEVYVANGDVIEIIVNGRSLGSPGRGVIKDLEITASGMKIK